MQNRIASDLMTYLPAKFLPALTAFITVPIFTRLFSPDQYGNYMLAFGVSEFLLAGACTGLIGGAVRFYAPYRVQDRLSSYFTSIFFVLAATTLGVTAISVALLAWFQPFISPELYPSFWAAIILFAVNGWFATLMSILRAEEKGLWYTVFELFNRYGGVLFSLVLILVLGMSVEGMLWGQTLALVIPVIPLMWLTTRATGFRPKHVNGDDVRQLWKYAWPLATGNLAFWGLRLADRYIIGIFSGSYEVGLYSVSYNISSRSIDLIVGLFLLVPGPIIMRLWEEKGRAAAEETLTAFSRTFFVLVIPAVVGISVLAVPTVRLLADQSYFEGHRAIWLVAAASMANGLGQLGSYGAALSYRTRQMAINQFIAVAVSLTISVVTVPMFGFMGAAVSSLASFSLLAGLQMITSSRSMTWRWPWMSLVRVLISSAAMGVGVLVIETAINPVTTVAEVITLLLAMVVGALVYGAALCAMGEISLSHIPGFGFLNRTGAISPAASRPEDGA